MRYDCGVDPHPEFAETLVRRVVLAVVLLVGCRQPPATTVGSAPIAVHTFGDTTQYASRIVRFDARTEELIANVKSPSYVIVLAVIPGKSIEQIVPDPDQLSVQVSTGKHTLNLRQQAFAAEPADAAMNSAELAEINRCVSVATAAARRQAQARRPVKRDSLGRIIEDRSAPPDDNIDDSRIEARCREQVRRQSINRPKPQMPIREPAERYLVVLTSAFPMTGPLIRERLESLVTSAPDVATTIEAIAQGLFAGKDPTWSGAYISWE